MTTSAPNYATDPASRSTDQPDDSFPRQYARTQRLTLGEPRNLLVTERWVIFLRSPAGGNASNQLWRADLATGEETLLADPGQVVANALGANSGGERDGVSAAERARRERMRESAGGITSFSTDREPTKATYSLAGMLFVTDLESALTSHLDVPGPVFDPRLSPGGDRVAYVCGRSLFVADLSTSRVALVAGDTKPHSPNGVSQDDSTVSWGSADFVAAEEMHRFRGFWWSPEGDRLAVCRVDESPVDVWYIADPAAPDSSPRPMRYPAAGTANPSVELYVVDAAGGSEPVRAAIDDTAWPYLASVDWSEHGLIAVVQTRSQRDVAVLNVDPNDGTAITVWTDHDPSWVELVPGAGIALDNQRVVMCADRDGARRLVLVADGEATPLSPADVQVRNIVAVNDERIVVTANPLDDATVQHVYIVTIDSPDWIDDDPSNITSGVVSARFRRVSPDAPGFYSAAVGETTDGGDTVVVRHCDLDSPGGRWVLPGGATLASFAETPLVRPNLTLLTAGPNALVTAVLLPHDHDGSPLPVLLDPYGGPHAQRVVRSYNAFTASQWFADQGFAVVITDGRGTPGRGSEFERAVRHDLAVGVLDDQIAGLEAAAAQNAALDLSRVAIRGWSFGGYLAALAVLRRPDVFHAAIAGAPVTEWRLYDTHYTERYLGNPAEQPEVYDANSLLPLAPGLTRPLLLIHGLADDNVVAAHSLRLSEALLAAGRPHELLPLVGVTHMTPQEVVAENLLLHQLAFLRRSLGVTELSRTNVGS